jgi:hypothetical protein
MIYKVFGYNTEHTYFDEATNINAKAEAEALLAQRQSEVLVIETARFSVCAVFVDGNNTTWREVLDSDPEDTVCKVFDTFTGQYTECANKTEAHNLNKQKEEAFLKAIFLDKVYEIDNLPTQEGEI